jgi:hypothetical protein
MNIVVFASIAIGLLAGAAVGYLVSRRLALRLAASSRHPSFVRAFAGVAGLLVLVPSGFLAFVVGGNFGGGVGAALLPEAVGVPLGLALGLGSVLALCLVAGSLLGALLGSGISALVRGAHEA